jgi:DnaJ-class molecular chaperone
MSGEKSEPGIRTNTDAVPEGTPDAGENVCRACGGTGKVAGRECPECGGSGKVLTPVGGAG